MSACTYTPYTLPTIDFVGGSTQALRFRVYWHSLLYPYDLTRCTANFSIVHFINKTGTTIISKQMDIEELGGTGNGNTYNVLTVTLLPQETVGLCGKYIYQITIKGDDGRAEVPNQGILYIANNINKVFITG